MQRMNVTTDRLNGGERERRVINLSSFTKIIRSMIHEMVSERTQDRERATWSTLSNSRMKLVIIEVNIIKRLISLQ